MCACVSVLDDDKNDEAGETRAATLHGAKT